MTEKYGFIDECAATAADGESADAPSIRQMRTWLKVSKSGSTNGGIGRSGQTTVPVPAESFKWHILVALVPRLAGIADSGC